MNIINVEHMTKDYGYGRGVFDVSLHVEKGEVFGFLGPNGAGKSTTIRHLMGFSKPDRGKVEIFGEPTFQKYYDVLKRLGYIPGEIALPAGLTGNEFLKMMQDLTGVKNEERINMLIVGSIFYKLAGLLLPIIYMIMASNNLISGQVDSGSMAYVLSTSTKRNTVAFTQAVYLVGSLLAMFLLTTATGCVCLAIVGTEVGLGYGELVLLNLGAFLVLFALAGLNFFTSCYFDRSKRSMAIGGGLSIFALVAAMLGLFGSPVIPKVVRLDSLNYFNYTTIISMFDVVSIMEGTTAFIWKFAILFVLGIIGIIAGSVKFIKKDLPL